MKKILTTIIFVLVLGGLALGGIYLKTVCSVNTKKTNIDVQYVKDKSSNQGYMVIGTREEVSQHKKMMENVNELVDPAYDVALHARDLFRQEKYSEAEKEAFRAIDSAEHHIVVFSAHQTLLRVYEATNNYEAAIKEIDWLLKNVNEHTKPQLFEKKAKYRQLLAK